jgi:hypothetical protein
LPHCACILARAVGNIPVAHDIKHHASAFDPFLGLHHRMHHRRQHHKTQMKTIDLTPTWSEVGHIFFRLAVSNERRALEAGKSEFVRGFAMATALNEVLPELTDEQRERVHACIAREMKKHGFDTPQSV